MKLLERFGDWIELNAQNRAFIAATKDNFQSRLSQEERQIVHDRRAEARKLAFIHNNEEALQYAKKDLILISDQYRPELLFDDGEFFGFKPQFSTLGFFKRKGCFLATWRDDAGDLASDTIDSVCDGVGLDQRVIILSLQREQSAVSKKKALPARKMNRILGYGMLDGKKKGDKGVDIVKYYGFRKQIESAARGYIKLAKGFKKDNPISVDFRTKIVTPLNAPTWAYYRYTPHIHAGKMSYLIGRSYFGF